jgi:PknH-like extracellular domain
MLRAMALAVSGVCILTACSSGTNQGSSVPTTTSTVAPAALDRLLLKPDQINAAMGATGISVQGQTWTTMGPEKEPVGDCLALANPAERIVYNGSGWMSVRGQILRDSGDATTMKHYVAQAVVSFPFAQKAADFFTASSQRWQTCTLFAGSGNPPVVWRVAPVNNSNNTLSTIKTQQGAGGWNCQRALTTRNNVAIDVDSCSFMTNQSASVTIAQQIAAKVPAA